MYLLKTPTVICYTCRSAHKYLLVQMEQFPQEFLAVHLSASHSTYIIDLDLRINTTGVGFEKRVTGVENVSYRFINTQLAICKYKKQRRPPERITSTCLIGDKKSKKPTFENPRLIEYPITSTHGGYRKTDNFWKSPKDNIPSVTSLTATN